MQQVVFNKHTRFYKQHLRYIPPWTNQRKLNSIRFLLFIIIRVLVYNSQSFNLRIQDISHPGLTRINRIRFLLFIIIRVLVYNLQSFNLRIQDISHPGLTRVNRIRFLLFIIIRVLVYYSQSFNLRINQCYTFSYEMYMPTKKYLRKILKIMFYGSNCD